MQPGYLKAQHYWTPLMSRIPNRQPREKLEPSPTCPRPASLFQGLAVETPPHFPKDMALLCDHDRSTP